MYSTQEDVRRLHTWTMLCYRCNLSTYRLGLPQGLLESDLCMPKADCTWWEKLASAEKWSPQLGTHGGLEKQLGGKAMLAKYLKKEYLVGKQWQASPWGALDVTQEVRNCSLLRRELGRLPVTVS